MTTHSPWGKTLIRFLCGLAVLLTISSAALAQPTGTVTKRELSVSRTTIQTLRFTKPITNEFTPK